MSHDWIKAPLALQYVSEGPLDDAAMQRICERAHSGLIATKAELFLAEGQERRNHLLNQSFWRAEGAQALQQDWKVGDFSSLSGNGVRVQAFGVSFDFLALSELIPAAQRAEGLRRISAMNNEAWISAADLLRMLVAMGDVYRAGEAILEACQLEQIVGRALLAQCRFRNRSDLDWIQREWEIPLWFWRDFARREFFQNWQLNKAHGKGERHRQYLHISLQGVHFHRSGLRNLGFVDAATEVELPSRAPVGRKPTYDWPATTVAVFGLIYRGDLKPQNQADIERALIEHLTKGDGAPSESTVRPYAKLVWDEYNKA